MDKTVRKAFEQTPLLAFSPGTVLQVQILREKAEDICCLMKESVTSDGPVNGNNMARAHGLFWLWVLGAYEVLRTMHQARECFSEDLAGRIGREKKYFAKIRMPFAKQEVSGKSVPDWKSGFAVGISGESGDFTFDISGVTYSAKELIGRFQSFMSGIALNDIKKCHLESY